MRLTGWDSGRLILIIIFSPKAKFSFPKSLLQKCPELHSRFLSDGFQGIIFAAGVTLRS